MNYKYIYNEQGQKEAVIIPIKEWENLTMQENKEDKVPLATLIDASKRKANSAEEIDAYINKLRDEWG